VVIITQMREKCIGCNYCVELAEHRWRMSKKDGKCTLVGGKNKKGFYTIRVGDEEYEENKKAAAACPVNIIKIKKK
jgi:ferredoxin